MKPPRAYPEPDFAVDIDYYDMHLTKESTETPFSPENQEVELSIDVGHTDRVSLFPNPELMDILQEAAKERLEEDVNCEEEVEVVREPKDLPALEDESTTPVGMESWEMSTQYPSSSSEETNTEASQLAESSTMYSPETLPLIVTSPSVPDSTSSPTTSLQSSVPHADTSQQTTLAIASGVSFSLLLLTLVLLAFCLKKHKKKLRQWFEQWRERSSSRQSILPQTIAIAPQPGLGETFSDIQWRGMYNGAAIPTEPKEEDIFTKVIREMR